MDPDLNPGGQLIMDPAGSGCGHCKKYEYVVE